MHIRFKRINILNVDYLNLSVKRRNNSEINCY